MTRRPEGYLRDLGCGRWELRVPLGRDPVTGKHRHRSKTVRARSRREAQGMLRAMLQEVGYRRDGDRTLGDAVQAWLDATRPLKAPRTWEEQRRAWRLHGKPTLGNTDLRRLEPSHLNVLYAGLVAAGKSTGTVRHVHNGIAAALEWAVDHGWIATNVARRAKPPAVDRAPVEPPTADRVFAALDAVDAWVAYTDDQRFAIFVKLAVATGMRRGEVCALRWGDVDWVGGALRVTGAVTKPAGKPPQRKATKTTSSVRTVAVEPEVLADLERYSQWSAGKGFDVGPDSYVLPWTWSTGAIPDNPKHYSQSWRMALERAGLPMMRLHDLRHAVASILLDAGIPVSEVSAQLGHARASTTQNVYGHLLRNRQHERAGIIAATLGRNDKNPAAPGR